MLKSQSSCAVVPLWESQADVFFGFHDLCQFDPSERYAIALEVGFLDRPPGPGDAATVLLADLQTGYVLRLDTTTAWNFPQGARQQWWPGRGPTHVYNQVRDGRVVAIAREVSGRVVGVLPGGVYSFSPDGTQAYSLDFSRLHHMGGYGYALGERPRAWANCPDDDGIWACDTGTLARRLLMPISRVAAALGQDAGQAQFLTHVVPSPSGAKLCFLHRSWLRDGGVNTALCVCDHDGTSLRVLGQGYYSHFDWMNDEEILVWGRPQDRLHGLRSKRGALTGLLLRAARPVWRVVKRRIKTELIGRSSYLLVRADSGDKRSCLPDRLTEDGHPCFSRSRSGWFITDTYPDFDGWRNLLLVNPALGTVHDLGRLGTPMIEPRTVEDYLKNIGVGEEAILRHGAWSYYRSRSGYSCDFHPRFDRTGRNVTIDSLHTGRRGVYRVDVSALLA